MIVNALRQTRPKNCGQTAVAMLAGKTIAEVEKVFGHRTKSYPSQIIKAVRELGFYPDERGFQEYQPGQTLPPLALIRVGFLKRTRNGYSTSGKIKFSGHLVLWANGNIFDPVGIVYNDKTLPRGMRIDTVLEVLAP